MYLMVCDEMQELPMRLLVLLPNAMLAKPFQTSNSGNRIHLWVALQVLTAGGFLREVVLWL
jgi:hypothetical protein